MSSPEPNLDLTPEERKKLLEIVDDPPKFARGFLGHDTWWLQEEIMRAVRDHRKVAVKACHSSSKTFLAAELAVWWITRWPRASVVSTAPSWTSVKDLLWKEIHKNLKDARDNGLIYPEPNQVEISIDTENYAKGLSTNKGVRFRGRKSGELGKLLLILDEANGIAPDIWEEIDGLEAGGNVHILALGNPTEASGPFYDIFAQTPGWKTFTISAFDTPNLKGVTLEDLIARKQDDPWLDDNPRPYLATRRWVWERYHKWGQKSAAWEGRVLGQFPTHETDALIPLAWIEKCVRRDGRNRMRPAWKKLPFTLGIDVARYGDDMTCFVLSMGPFVVGVEEYAKQSTMETVGRCVQKIRECEERGIRIVSIRVDDTGVGGGVTDRLEELGYEVHPVNFGSRAYNETQFQDWRSEAWWCLREKFSQQEISIPDDEKLIRQLAAPKYKILSTGKTKMESKDEMKKRGVASPDEGDALALSQYPEDWLATAEVAVV